MRKYPFKFLNSYSKEDKAIFFGREMEINSLYRMVFQTNLLLVYGASGTGKTSLIRCGLANRFEAFQWQDLYIRRGDDINKNLLKVVQERIPAPLTTTTEENEKSWFKNLMETNEATTRQVNSTVLSENKSPIVEALNDLYQASFTPIYLIFDQFEELYTLGKEAEQKQFVKTVAELVKLPLPLKIILVIREEYLSRLYELEKAVPQLRNKKLRVAPMDMPKVSEVILKSTMLNPTSNIQLEKGREKEIADLIVDKIREGDINIKLPYLQVFMDYLYEQVANSGLDRSKNITINFTSVQRVGKIGDVLADFLVRQSDRIYQDLLVKYKNLPDDIVWRILFPFTTIDGTKKPIKENDFVAIKKSLKLKNKNKSNIEDLIKLALVALENKRILRYRQNARSYEISHDILAKKIAEKRSEEEKVYLKAKSIVESSYHKFSYTKSLLNKADLDFIKPFTHQLSQDISTEQKNFISTSKNRHRRRLKLTITGIVGLVILLSGLTLSALQGKWETEQAIRTMELNEKKRIAQELKTYGDSFRDLGKKQQAKETYQAALDNLNGHDTLALYNTLDALIKSIQE